MSSILWFHAMISVLDVSNSPDDASQELKASLWRALCPLPNAPGSRHAPDSLFDLMSAYIELFQPDIKQERLSPLYLSRLFKTILESALGASELTNWIEQQVGLSATLSLDMSTGIPILAPCSQTCQKVAIGVACL